MGAQEVLQANRPAGLLADAARTSAECVAAVDALGAAINKRFTDLPATPVVLGVLEPGKYPTPDVSPESTNQRSEERKVRWTVVAITVLAGLCSIAATLLAFGQAILA